MKRLFPFHFPKTRSAILLLLSLTTAVAEAQTSRRLTVGEAVQLGLQNSKQLRLDSAKLRQSILKLEQVKDYSLPEVRVNASYNRLSDITPIMFQLPSSPEPVVLMPNIPNTYAVSASLRQGIFTGFKLKYTQESYDFLNKAMALDVEKDKADVRMNIISAFISFTKLSLSRTIIDENLAAARQRAEEARSMRDRGLATDNDVLKAELYQSNIELSKTDADNGIAVSQFNLGLLLGLPDGTVIEPDTTGLFEALSLKTEQAYEQDALASRSDVKATDVRLQAAETGIKLARSGYYPTLSLGADYLDARPNQRIFPLQDKFNATWNVGLTLSWNLTGLYTTRHTLQDAQVQRDMTTTQSQQLSDNVRSEIFQAYTNCQSSLSKMNTLELAVKQSQENNRQVKARYDQHLALMSDVLDADAALLQSRINLVMQRAETSLNYYRLQKSAGTLK